MVLSEIVVAIPRTPGPMPTVGVLARADMSEAHQGEVAHDCNNDGISYDVDVRKM